MIDILAHVIQVVVFAPSPDALLGIGSSAQLGHGVRWVNSVQKDGFELKKKGNISALKEVSSHQVVTWWQVETTQKLLFVMYLISLEYGDTWEARGLTGQQHGQPV